MKIGIMQPYFFPYLGYFQLIQAVDVYVNLEHVAFMKRSYMTRNTLKNNTSISIPVSKASQNKTCREIEVLADTKWFNAFEKTLEYLYKKEPQYTVVLDKIIHPWKDIILEQGKAVSISEFNFSAIKHVCEYLNIKCDFQSSQGITSRKKNEGLQDIVKYYNCNHYINAIGGQELYSAKDFASQEITLNFIKMGKLDLDTPYSSILDLLFRYSKEHLKTQLNNYSLI